MLFFLLQEFQQQRHCVRVELQEVLNLAIGVLQSFLICRESHDGVKQRLVTKGYFKKSGMEEIGEVFVDAVVVMGDVLVEIVETSLKFDGKVLPVWRNVAERIRN